MTRLAFKNQDPHEQGRFFRDVVVDRKDMEQLLVAFEDRGFRINFYAQGGKYRGRNEIAREHRSHINELEIHGYDKKLGSVSVLFQNDNARIRADGSFVAKELQHELALFLSSRQSITKRVSSWIGWRAVSFAAFMAEFVLLFLEPVRVEIPRLFHVYLWGAAFLWPASWAITRFLRPVEISPEQLTAVRR